MRPTKSFAATSPVAVLREHATSLEAAMQLTLGRPKKEAVHRLRTTIRRMEAQLELLKLLADDEPRLAGFPHHAKKVGKLLKRVRRAAGEVRDLDVQRALVKEAVADGIKKRASQEAKDLRSTLKHQREHDAEVLIDELKAQGDQLGPRLQRLLESLEPVAAIQLSSKRLAVLVRDWYTARATSADSTEDGLHTRRKAAKLARYMLENAHPALARQFEELQELGGHWHDALQLQRLIRDRMGRKTALRETFRTRKDEALRDFRQRLASFQPQL